MQRESGKEIVWSQTLRLNAKEVLMPKKAEEFVIPFTDGSVKLEGRD